MQVFDLIYNYKFMESYNLSAPTDTMIDDMKSLTQFDWFLDSRYTWLNYFRVPFALVPSKYGLCFNFNMVDSLELLNLNE
jgi:hypothetical protein